MTPRAQITARLPLPGESILTSTGRRRVLLVVVLAVVAAFGAGQWRGLSLGGERQRWALSSQAWRYSRTLTACADVLALAAQLERLPGWRNDARVVALAEAGR